VAGTLRVLADAAARGLTDLEESFERLRHTNFRVSSALLESLLEEHIGEACANDGSAVKPAVAGTHVLSPANQRFACARP
jgi:hypothetical protein